MNASFGFNATRYVKFWSGPTPIYTPSGFVFRRSSGITCWKLVSLETKLSERKKPPGSEKSFTIRQNSASEYCDGSGKGFRFDRGTSRKAHALASTNPTMLNRYVRFSCMFLILSLGCRLDKTLIDDDLLIVVEGRIIEHHDSPFAHQRTHAAI